MELSSVRLRIDEAYETFRDALPLIVFSLQNPELLYHVEKSLLAVRGIIKEASLRDASLEPNPHDRYHVLLLNRKILEALGRLNLPREPRAFKAAGHT